MYIPRLISKQIIDKLNTSNKGIIIYGARQVGKTTLARQIVNCLKLKTLVVNADEQKYINVFSSRDLNKMKSLVAGYDLLIIDEAQRIQDIGINLKILIDNLPGLKIIATGSSSFDLANKIAEPLTGRVWTYKLYPLAIYELKNISSAFEIDNKLEERLIYGSYPEVYTTISIKQKKELLEEISRSYLYKDVLHLVTIKHINKINDLLKLLAFQIGSEVSIQELSAQLDMSRGAVDRYIDLLEKSFILFRLKGFSRNLRKEVSKMDKIYFYDNGIRNVIIDNLKPLKDRSDTGQLWENFLIIERQKYLEYKRTYAMSYFWRTYTGAELDYVEECENRLYGYEFKFSATKEKAPHSWMENYPKAEYKCINKDSYLNFVSD